MTTIAAVRCVDCGQALSASRLEFCPDGDRCRECQAVADVPPDRSVSYPCPRCGGRLEWRNRRNGTADYFIGCTRFPQCWHTE